MDWKLILIIAGFAAFCGWLIYKRLSRPKKIEARVNRIKDRRVLPSGLRLWVEKGATVTDDEIWAIQDGIREVLSRPVIAERGYTKCLRVSDYIVVVLAHSVRAPESQVWSQKIPVAQYGGGIFDSGGFVYAAEIVVGSALNNVIGVPDQMGENITLPNGQTDREEMAAAVGAGVEHCVLAHNDPVEFARTLTHTATSGHPLF